jgi:hypothetical protein
LNDQVSRVIERVRVGQRPAVARALSLLHDAYVAELADGTSDAEKGGCAVAP